MKNTTTIEERINLSTELDINTIFEKTSKNVLDEDPEKQSQLDGPQGWIVVTASFFHLFVVLGTIYGSGIFVKYYSDELFKDEAALTSLSFISTLGTSTNTLLAIFTGRLADKIGYQKTAFIGSVIYSLGLLLASFSKEVWHLILTQGAMVGIGSSIAFIPAVSAPVQWFDKHIGLATGIFLAGSGVGGLVLNPTTQYIVNKLGFRWALRIQAMISIVILPITAFFLKERIKITKKTSWFDFSKFKDRRFLIVFFGGSLCAFGYLVPLLLMSKYAQSVNLTDTQGAILVALLNAGSAIGRVALGNLGDYFGRYNILFLCITLNSFLCYFIWTFSYTFNMLLLFCILYGIAAGGFISMLPVVTVQLFGAEGIASINGLLYFGAGIPSLIGTPIASAILTASSPGLSKPNYIPVIMYSGTSALLGSMFFLVLKLMVNRKVFICI
ncbi:MFS general substrate transporter [Neoconidiobolus thromboides FSU 785]|nr:MFS general substrate transporter [Neoconidiobolus thromboides FSU 785]